MTPRLPKLDVAGSRRVTRSNLASVHCPICKRQFEPGERRYAPFCSERCKLIDLGDWAAEKFRVPEAPPKPDGEPD